MHASSANWPEDIPGSTSLIVAHNTLNNAESYPPNCPLMLVHRKRLAKRVYDVEEAAIRLNSSKGTPQAIWNSFKFRWKIHQLRLVCTDYHLAEIGVMFSTDPIPDHESHWRPGVLVEKTVQGEKGLIRKRIFLSPSNPYMPCRDGCLMPRDWMARHIK
ncbi:hypothetical protein VKT23_005980 [Stygiomarasmius scandens]|uniref:Uncharacterized protein n=1 Tax=Marasmiellus scandens TaxID=2682957 RepID=A0ABR1JP03_9AGAR